MLFVWCAMKARFPALASLAGVERSSSFFFFLPSRFRHAAAYGLPETGELQMGSPSSFASPPHLAPGDRPWCSNF
jgi:hypothetical protein